MGLTGLTPRKQHRAGQTWTASHKTGSDNFDDSGSHDHVGRVEIFSDGSFLVTLLHWSLDMSPTLQCHVTQVSSGHRGHLFTNLLLSRPWQ